MLHTTTKGVEAWNSAGIEGKAVKYRMIDLFAGAGGLTLGFVQASKERILPVAAVDNDNDIMVSRWRTVGVVCL